MSSKQFLMGYGMPRSKYGAKKTTLDGITFDSQKEALRYAELHLMEKAGLISDLTLQKKLILIPAQYEEVNGKRKCIERECSYIADFTYYQDGKLVVEDTKGMKTPEYKIKRKLMLQVYGIKIKES